MPNQPSTPEEKKHETKKPDKNSKNSEPKDIPAQVARTQSSFDLESEIIKQRSQPIERIRTDLAALEAAIARTQGEINRLNRNINTITTHSQEHINRIKGYRKLPYVVCNVAEHLGQHPDLQATEERPANDPTQGGPFVIKTQGKVTYYLDNSGLVPSDSLSPGTLVGASPDTMTIMALLPREFDDRVKAMKVMEKPDVKYADIGGLEKAIEELHEAIVLPITDPDRFKRLGVLPPKGVLLYGPPGTGKTMLARAVASQTNATFIKLAGTSLVQMFIGEGARLVRDAFTLARQNAPSIIFIDELDAVGGKRGGESDKHGSREIHRTMMELLNQLDGFQQHDSIKIIGATNRPDTLDPALLRSGRLDRKIEIPPPDEAARMNIIRIHARRMNVSDQVNYRELAAASDDFNAAQCKAIAVEAGMIALRRDAANITHDDFMDAVLEVQCKKSTKLCYIG